MSDETVPAVYILIGAQGSGKSTWARANAARLQAEVLASDEVRNELETTKQGDPEDGDQVFAVVETRLADLLAARRNVIVDATHAVRDWRKNHLAIARRAGARTVAVWFDVPLGVALQQNRRKPGGPLWGDRRVPEPVVRGIHRKLEPPGEDEFDEIWRVA